jgi:protein-tyrosine phosphatase
VVQAFPLSEKEWSSPVIPKRNPESSDVQKTRLLPFQRVSNFRDLGGYHCRDGRTVRWGKLFRSGHLAHASVADRRRLSHLGIRTLIDFRSEQEIIQEPDRLPEKARISVVSLPIQQEGMPPLAGEIRQMIETRSLDGQDPDQTMIEMYRLLAVEYQAVYREFFQVLLSSKGEPVLWHCSAGKDRAGFAAALLLKLLGVPWQTILEDYLLSRGNIAPRRRQLLLVSLLHGRKAARYLQRLNEVEGAWLQAAFQTLEDRWGSFEGFTKNALQLNSEDIHLIQNSYLVPPIP